VRAGDQPAVLIASDRWTATIGSAFAPATFDRGASASVVARVGERKAMLIAAAVTTLGLGLCILHLGRGTGPLMVYSLGVLLIGAASSIHGLARQSYLTEMVPVQMRARALSTLGGTLRIWIPRYAMTGRTTHGRVVGSSPDATVGPSRRAPP
jgi:hypothetical protein